MGNATYWMWRETSIPTMKANWAHDFRFHPAKEYMLGMKCPSITQHKVDAEKKHNRMRIWVYGIDDDASDEQLHDIKAFLELANGSFNNLPQFKTHHLRRLNWIDNKQRVASALLNPVTHYYEQFFLS